ncbi:hypothetical protein GB937_009253 [Aspergillus fischeri]|nr:hypothetical protein GB937_009253 [Aspergillus fischeri]
MSEMSISLNNPVRTLSPSDTLRPCADAIVEMTHKVIASSESPDPATRFDLREEFAPVIKEAKRLYQETSSHGAVFQKSPYVGRLHNTIVVPIENMSGIKVTVRDTDGNAAEVDWTWRNFLFASRLTYVDIEKGKKVGAVVVHFPRKG